MKALRIFLMIVGVLLALIGIGWFLQGMNVLPGSIMSGKLLWVINGIIAFAVGIILILVISLTGSKNKK